MPTVTKITPCLWFHYNCEEAIHYIMYRSLTVRLTAKITLKLHPFSDMQVE